LSKVFELFFPEYAMSHEAGHFVELPSLLAPGAIYQLPVPNFDALYAPAKLIPLALLIAVIASLESLLSIEAVDKLDPYRRMSPPNKELRAQGLGNILSGLLGGLPITAVIVRSSANVYAGGRTNLSTIFHGYMLFIAVLLAPDVLRLIPLSCLAAILIHVGYKLAPIKLFKEMRRSGLDQFLPFVATILGIIFTDLLTGVAIGLVIGIFYVLKLNHHNAVTFVQDGNDYMLRFNKDISFINKMELKDSLKLIPDGVNLIIDGTRSMYIDRDIYDVLSDFEKNCAHRGISIKQRNIEDKVIRLSHLKGANG
jgi:MFS superfamily sulfate permease-like transporter